MMISFLDGLSILCEERPAMSDALADLSYHNYVEMRDHTASTLFLIQKSIENFIHSIFPTSFIPLYTMVEKR